MRQAPLLLSCIALVCGGAQKVLANTTGGAAAIITLTEACAGVGENPLPKVVLAEEVFENSGVSILAVLSDERIPSNISDNSERLVWLADHLSVAASQVSEADRSVFETIRNIERYFAGTGRTATEPVSPINLASLPSPATTGWLFSRETSVSLKCSTKAGKDQFVYEPPKFDSAIAPLFALRAKPEEFALDAKSRKTAGATTLGFEKVYDRDPDTDLRNTETLTVSGAAGLRLTKSDAAVVSYAYGRYEHKKVRTSPLPELAEGERRNMNDTDSLELGVMVETELSKNESPLKVILTSTTGYTMNFVDNSERLRTRNLFELTDTGWQTPICSFGQSKELGIGDLRGRCLFRIDTEASTQTKRGLAEMSGYDDFFGIGGEGTFEVFSTLEKKSQVIATATARYLPVIAGGGDDIWRLELSAKQRYWFNKNVGFDIGATFVDGRNDLTLEEEKKLTLGFGLIM